MEGINFGKVFVSGIVAAVVMTLGEFVLNEVVLVEAQTAAFERMNLEPPGGAAIGVFIGLTFLAAWTMMWLYAAIRGPMGAGPKTAACAGIVTWLLMNFTASVSFAAMGMLPAGTVAVATTWGFVEFNIAAIAGAYFYRD